VQNYKNFIKSLNKTKDIKVNLYQFKGFAYISEYKNTYDISGIILDKNLIIPIKNKKINYKYLNISYL
jgi:hypothetical protein